LYTINDQLSFVQLQRHTY